MAQDKKDKQSIVLQVYLSLYNTTQFIGWTYIFVQFMQHFFVHGEPLDTLWSRIGQATFFFQMLAVLEVIHAATGIVPSNALMTFLQVFGRSMIVAGAIEGTPTGQLSPGLPLAVFCWSLTEIFRYSYYVAHLLLPSVPSLLVWIRYTIFIPMYPCGFLGELLCSYWAQSYIRETGKWSVELPNRFNFSFSFFYFMWIMAICYMPLFPQMYLHMFAQRRKVLGRGAGQQKATKTH
ncbi:very-long-chain (3R)-3-hydroxyacyl-CoA dehydratase 2-like [Anopheles maculipalpis]|uniref:very-long-chain (3R)-3-hydroxyacyl-CoA dehydratase 2-like n=1 Tax=Anopheles maculipalpis TaxID=1496333 RepID=UPI002158BF6C|nr:very-long-chain (3R)-3-hydroxyacyl-CoA dehydratase 2-like [Anopheles maculipalpis]